MEERFTPRMYIDYYTKRHGFAVKDIGVAPVVVISWSPTVVQGFAEITGAQPTQHWPYYKTYLFFTGQVGGQQISFAQTPIGAPATVTMMEEMIACGAQLFLGLGWAGSLQPSAKVGTFLIPTSCVREEGTSPHYVDDDAAIVPDIRLAELLETAAKAEGHKPQLGPQWTTDAPYRELKSKIAAYGRKGVLGVDMETSAMYALGRFRNVAVCNLLIVSDELWEEWRPAFGTPTLTTANEAAQRAILRVLDTDLQSGFRGHRAFSEPRV